MRRGILFWRNIAVYLLFAFVVAGCGSSTMQGSGSMPNDNGTPTTTPGYTNDTPTAGPATTTTTGTPNGQSGQITLLMSAQQYTSDSPLLVTIRNGMQTAIWIQAQMAACSSLTVERMDNGSWVQTGNCAPAGAPRSTQIAAGASLVQRIDFAQGMDTGAGWPAGTYRVVLDYTLSATASSSAGAQAQSGTFTIS